MKAQNSGGSTVLYVLRITAILFVIASVVAAALAGVNQITKPIIERQNAEKTLAAISAVLTGGGESIPFSDETGTVKAVYKGENGYAVQVAPQGFDGAIDMMVGIDLQGAVTRISIISQSETAGLGAVCAADTSAGEAFRAQFSGVSGSIAVAKYGGDIDAITGATITSRAVTRGVNTALECVQKLMFATQPLE